MLNEVNASDKDTIAALATPPGRGGIAVIRVSGPKVRAISKIITNKNLQPRKVEFVEFSDDDLIDQGIALLFEKPASYTGEDVLELHSHGSPAVTQALLNAVILQGARLAKPGEFSERAYLNGKLDLSQAEAVADLIESASAQAARSAARTLQGQFSAEIESIVQGLIELRAYVEAALDFPEEEIDFLKDGLVEKRLQMISKKLEAAYNKGKQGKSLHDGFTLALLGEPNTGKSSLLNQLAGYDAAIVTNIPGTTRDVLDHDIVLDGILFKVLDTAGLRNSDDPIEKEGIRRAKIAAEQADVVLLITDCNEQQIENSNGHLAKEYSSSITIQNKIDLANLTAKRCSKNGKINVYLSAKTGEGLELLVQEIKNLIAKEGEVQGAYTANQRHLAALEQTKETLLTAKKQLLLHEAGELLAEDLGKAHQLLGEITGEFYPDDLLGEIFSRFCIGK